MDEDYDELMGPMGPRPGQSMRKTFEDEEPGPLPTTSKATRDPVARKSSSSGPPPTLFHSMPDRWAQHEGMDDVSISSSRSRQSTGSKNIMSFDEEEEDPTHQAAASSHIRQEALRMLEVADSSGPYSVHRTVSGGFMAEHRSMGSSRRVPTALAGLGSFAKPNRPKKAPPTPVYRDDPPLEEDYRYGGDDDSRFAEQNVKEEPKQSSSSWSSRYSVDDTLFAMAGGAVKSPQKTPSSFLDKLDTQHERKSARNMFMASPIKDSKIFGSGGFNFREKNVFGKQNVVASDNLRTVWMDAGASNSPARSWQDNLKEMRKKRRTYLIVAAILCACLVTLVAILGARNGSGDMASSTLKNGPNDEEAITFLITSDIPWNADEEKQLEKELKTMSSRADFFVHLGNIQDAAVTQCEGDHYKKVADILKESPIPVFVLPGQEDWNNCDDQDRGWYHWLDNFLRFDNYFDKDYEMMRQESQPENFAFIDRDVLFVSVHETNGRIDELAEVKHRNKANVEWVAGVTNASYDDIRALVIFSNGRPLREENNDFYMGLAKVLYEMPDLPTAFIHANDGDGDDSLTYKMYDMDGMDHVTAIQSTRGENHAPLRIHVGWDETNPFILG